MKYRKTARPIVLALAAMLAIPPVSASAITFADINQVPWPGAEVPINKAAELKLVVGETINGKNYFKPKDPVSLTQTCQLAYKLLLETGKAKADASLQEKWLTVMNTYKIQSWAHPAVSFCLEKGIISISDLSGFVSGEVNKSATREQAAEILGRALTVGVPSKTASATSTNFKDNASISKDAIPYIALLNAEKIVNGDDLGKFNPKNTLNRTETAVMVTNLYEKLKSAVVVPEVTKPTSASGKIADMNKAYVNFENSTAYYLYSPSGVTVTLNGSASSTAALIDLFKTGTAINASLTLDSDARITKLAATSEKVLEETEEKDTEGTLTTMKYDDEDDDGKITLNGKSTYNVENDYVSIEIDDEDYDLEDLYELYKECKDDDKKITVKLTLDKDGDIRKIVGKIKNADGKSEGDVEGILTDVDYDEDDEEGEIEIDNDDEYDFDDSTDIEIDGKKADWEDLMDLFEEAEDDDEELEVILFLDDDDFATSIEVYTEDYEPEEDKDEAKGTVDEVTYDEDDDDAKITVDNKTYKTSEVDSVEVEVKDGGSNIDTWYELYYAYKDGKEMDVELIIEDGEVVEITGNVTMTAGYLTGFGDEFLRVQGKKSNVVAKYTFTKYDRSDEDEEEDWQEAAEKIKISGISKVNNLFDFYDRWLDDEDTQLGRKDDDDCFFLKMELDKNGYIKKITGEYK